MNRYWRLFEDAVENDPEEVAIDDGLPLRFIDLRNAAVRLSRAWANSGLKVGHTIAVIDSLNARTAIALFASWRLGIRPLMVPPWMTIGEAEDLRDRIGAQAIWDSFSGVFIGGCLVYQTSRIVNADMYFVTSGTTGAPKIVAHSNESLLAGLAAAMSYQTGEPGASAPDFAHTASPYKFRLGFRHFCTMPISTIAGFTNLQRAVLSGDTLVLCHSSRSEEILQRLRETSSNVVSLTPFLAAKLAREVRIQGWQSPSLVTVGIGGGRVTESAIRVVEDTFGCPTIAGYGMTETGGPVIMGNVSDPLSLRSSYVGRLLPQFKLRFVGPEGATVNAGKDSPKELAVKGSSMMLGYVDNAGNLDPSVLGDGWFKTGDLVVAGPGGLLGVLGRSDGLMIRGGRNIDPSEIESVLNEHQDVARSLVVGFERGMLGEHDIHAFVELIDGGSSETGELLKWCVARLSPLLVPRKIEIRSSIPTAADGEVRRLPFI